MALIELILLAWIIKVILDFLYKNQSHSKEDMEKFWGAKFDGTSFVDPREVLKPDDSFLRRLKRRFLPKRFSRRAPD